MTKINKWKDEWYTRACELKQARYSNKEIAEQLNKEFDYQFSDNSVKRKFANEGYQKQKVLPNPEKTHNKLEINENGTHTSVTTLAMTREQMKDKEFVLKAHGFDPDEFQIKSVTNNFWQQNSTENGLIDLYQSKVIVEPLKHEMTEEYIINLLIADVEPVKLLNTISGNERNLVIPLADLHFGISTYEVLKVKQSEIIQVINKGYKQIVFEHLGDLFHSDFMNKSQTVRGTILEDVDTVKAIEDCKRFIEPIVEAAIRHSQQVNIYHTGGNHSFSIEYMFFMYLEAKYPQINIHNNIENRTAYLIDNVGIMISHGDTAKKDLPMLFANEFVDTWCKATTRELHTGHLHKIEVTDHSGVIQRQMGTLKKNDKYEKENGWTMNKKVIQLFEYDADRLKVTYDV